MTMSDRLYQPHIPIISKIAPPSYTEAMAQNATKDNSHTSPYRQPMTMYDQGCSQMPSYSPSAPANNFYLTIHSQPVYNSSCIRVEPSQQYCSTTPTIVRVEPISAQEKLCNCIRCASFSKTKVISIIGLLCIIILIIIHVILRNVLY